MHGHVSKRVKMHIKPTGGATKHGKHNMAQNGRGKRCARSNQHHGDVPQVVTPKRGLVGVRCNHTTINLLRASSVAKPRTREANMSIKHGSKRA